MAFSNITSLIKEPTQHGTKTEFERLGIKLNEDIKAKNDDGYRVVSVVPLTGCCYNPNEHESHGVSHTIGLLVVYERT